VDYFNEMVDGFGYWSVFIQVVIYSKRLLWESGRRRFDGEGKLIEGKLRLKDKLKSN